ncbi:MAG: diacylglycerol kinase family protein [Acidimicrobiales bacterium]
MATVGIIVNPAAGKDIRRLVASASPSSDVAKMGMVRRAVIGAVEGGATRVLLSADRHELGRRAVDGLDLAADIEVVGDDPVGTGRDASAAARRLQCEAAGAVVVLGGDGTQRDVAQGWLSAPIVAVSVGTNNVFPRAVEATVAGHTAALVATGSVPLDDVSRPAKVIHAQFDGDSEDDLALVDVALVEGNFTGSRAVWDPTRIRSVVAAIAEPSAVGLSAVAAMGKTVSRHDDGGVRVDLGPSGAVGRAPIAPGLYADVSIEQVQPLADDETTSLVGPGVLAFDGERDRVLASGESTRLTVRRDGPRVIDIERTMGAEHPSRTD